jgi:hypothetical protein
MRGPRVFEALIFERQYQGRLDLAQSHFRQRLRRVTMTVR